MSGGHAEGVNARIKSRYVFTGTCRLEDGSPMAGCVAQLGRDFVVSNSEGFFELKSNKKSLPVHVIDFAAPGEFRVISSPSEALADSKIEIVVQRLP